MASEFSKQLLYLPGIPKDTVFEYENRREELIEYTVQKLLEDDKSFIYLDEYPRNFVYQDQLNFSKMLQIILVTNQYELLFTYLPWYYRSRLFRNFQKDYFEKELIAWKEAVLDLMTSSTKEKLSYFLNWLINNIDELIIIAKKSTIPLFNSPKIWRRIEGAFFSATMQGELDRCLKIAHESVVDGKSLSDFYEYVLKTVMYKVGYYWEMNQLSILHEQHATNIVMKVREELSKKFIEPVPVEKARGTIVMTTSSQFSHELGINLLKDLLTYHKWKVTTVLGNTNSSYNTAKTDSFFHDRIIETVNKYSPDALVISLSMSLDLWEVRKLISSMRIIGSLDNTQTIIGGRVVSDFPKLDFAKLTGSDKRAASLAELLKIIGCQNYKYE